MTASIEENRLAFEVADNGIGMTDKVLNKAIEPLFTTRAKRTGIGLANVQKIISNHGGKITLKSKPDHGTTARFTLPYSATPDESG